MSIASIVTVNPIFESQTHMCHSDAGAEADVSTRLHSMQLGQYPARVWSQRGQHFTVAAQVHNTTCY